MGRDTGTNALIAIDIILVMIIELFLKCYLNLMPVGDPIILVNVIWAGLGEEEVRFRSIEKDVQLCSHCFLNGQERGMNKIK